MSSKLAVIAQQLALSAVILSTLDKKHQQVVTIKDYPIEEIKPTRVIPIDHAGDPWRRQGKRRGSPRR